MRRSNTSRVIFALVLSLFASATFAQVARVFVSVNGNDVNTCSNVATPCRTFSGGITQVDDGGEVIVLDTGSYGGTTITKGVTLNVPPGVVAFAAQPFTINAPGKNVTLRGLTLKALTPGNGVAVTFTAGSNLTIENCVINGWDQGVSFVAAGTLIIRDSVLKSMASFGILVQPASGNAFATVVRCQFDSNAFGGLQARENSKVWARDCVFTGNFIAARARSGTAAVPAEMDVRNCLFTNNSYGPIAQVFSGGTAVTRVSGCMIMGNSNGMGTLDASSTLESYGDNDVRGNGIDTVGTITPIGGTRQ
jgi:parallel beta helix pectate lyase-like protein